MEISLPLQKFPCIIYIHCLNQGLVNPLELGRRSFHIVLSSKYTLLHIMPTLIFEIKTSNLFQMKILSLLFHVVLLFSIDTCRDPIMADDVITSSNPLVVPVWNEKFEKTLIDMNVFQ